MATPKRKDLTVAEKVSVITELSLPGASYSQVAQKFGIGKATVSRIVKSKDAILAEFDSHGTSERRRLRQGKDEDVEVALSEWLKQKVAQGARLSGPQLKEKAIALASLKGVDNFIASDGWLQRWKKRYGICFKREHGERQDANQTAADLWLNNTLPELLHSFSPDNIFNADETVLYYRGFPDRGHCEAKDDLRGGKKAMERITLLVCSNMSGTDKIPLLVIGKSKQPRCFPKNHENLPVTYSQSKNAWMTGNIFVDWTNSLNKKMRLQNRQICLLIDNCTAHPPDCLQSFSNVTVKFLPANTTSILQPMDQGIIKNLKGHYRVKLNQRIIMELDANPNDKAIDVSRRISLLDAIYHVKSAWDMVKPETISNCFRKAGFCTGPTLTPDSESADPLSDVIFPDNMSPEDFTMVITQDDNLICMGQLTDHEIMDNVQSKRRKIEETEEEEEDREPPMTSKEKTEMVKQLRRFIQERSMTSCLKMFEEISSQVSRELSENQQQRSLLDYFQIE